MSIKTFPGGPDKNLESFLIFFGISIVIHLTVLWVLDAFAPAVNRVIKGNEPLPKENEQVLKKNEPLPVDIVDLPPLSETTLAKSKKSPTHHAVRSQSVEEETYPEPRPTQKPRAARVIPAPQSSGSKSAKGQTGDKKAVKEDAPSNAKNETAQSKSIQENKSAASSKTTETEKAGINTAKPAEVVKPSEKDAPPTPAGTGKSTDKTSKESAKNKPQRPNLFPSDERIAELEKKYETDPNKGEKGKTLQLNTAETKYAAYTTSFKKKLDLYWEYPMIAVRNGWQGKVLVDFTFHKDGKITDINVVKSSGYPALDDAVVMALRLSSPFKPFPENYDIEELTIKGTFEYIDLSGRQGQP